MASCRCQKAPLWVRTMLLAQWRAGCFSSGAMLTYTCRLAASNSLQSKARLAQLARTGRRPHLADCVEAAEHDLVYMPPIQQPGVLKGHMLGQRVGLRGRQQGGRASSRAVGQAAARLQRAAQCSRLPREGAPQASDSCTPSECMPGLHGHMHSKVRRLRRTRQGSLSWRVAAGPRPNTA